MRRKQFLGIILGLGVLPVVGFAQSVEPANPLAAEPKLAQKTRLKIEGMSVSELLKRLSKLTGVDLSAKREAGLDKVVIYSPSRPLYETLDDLAELFGDEWLATKEKTKSGETVYYTLVRTGRARERERELHDAPMKDTLAQLDAMTRKPETDPKLKRLKTIFGGMSLMQREALVREGWTVLPLDQLNRTQWEALTELRPGLKTLAAKAQGAGSRQSLDPYSPIRSNRLGAVPPNRSPTKPEFKTDEGKETEDLDARIFAHGLIFKTVPFSPWLPQFVTIDQLGNILNLKDRDSRLPEHSNPYRKTPEPSPKFLPSVEQIKPVQQISPEYRGEPLERMSALSKNTERAILSDFYRTQPLIPSYRILDTPDAPESAIKELDELFVKGVRTWWQRKTTLFVRQLEWARQNAYEIPDEWFDRVVARTSKSGNQPTLKDLQPLLQLTKEQMTALTGELDPYGNKGGGSLEDELSMALWGSVLNEFTLFRLPDCNVSTRLPLETPPLALDFNQFSSRTRQEMLPLAELSSPQKIEKNANLQFLFSFYGIKQAGFHHWTLALGKKEQDAPTILWTHLVLPTVVPKDHRDKAEIEITEALSEDKK